MFRHSNVKPSIFLFDLNGIEWRSNYKFSEKALTHLLYCWLVHRIICTEKNYTRVIGQVSSPIVLYFYSTRSFWVFCHKAIRYIFWHTKRYCNTVVQDDWTKPIQQYLYFFGTDSTSSNKGSNRIIAAAAVDFSRPPISN